MVDNLLHLDQLRIDRNKPGHSAWRSALLALLVIVILGAGCIGIYYHWPANRGLPIHAIKELSGDGGDAGQDRQASRSAQVLGGVIYRNVQEDAQVRGDVVARLNNSNYLAALQKAPAQQTLANVTLNYPELMCTGYQRLHQQNAIGTSAYENERAACHAARITLAEAGVDVARSNKYFTVVRAPFAGILTEKVAQIGDVPAAASGGATKIRIITR